MKLVKTASGKKIIKMSKSEWQSIGRKAGWIKESAGWSTKFPDMTEDDWKKLDKSHKEKFQKFEDEKAKERKLILEERRQENEDYKKREELRKKRQLKELKDKWMRDSLE